MDPDAREVLRSAPASFEADAHLRAPCLKPLAPPRGSAAWIFKEPKEFYAQRERHEERQARSVAVFEQKRALQELGHPVSFHRPCIANTIDSDPPPSFRSIRPPLSAVWGPPPVLERAAKSTTSLLAKPFRGSEAPRGPVYLEDNRATVGGEKARISKEMWNTLTGWGRGYSGTPWTLKQVHAEIEADIQHKKARDTRAKGTMGVQEIGKGTTKQRREMVQFNRTFERNNGFTSTAGSGFAATSASGSDATMMRTTNSLPALTQDAAF